MGTLTSGVKGLALTNDTEKPQEERFNIFYNFVKVPHIKMNSKEFPCEKFQDVFQLMFCSQTFLLTLVSCRITNLC